MEDAVETTEEINEDVSEETPDAQVDAQTDEALVEAVLFTSDSPLPPAKVATATELTPRRIKKAVEQLNKRYTQGGHAFRIEEIAGGYQMMTLPEFHDVLRRLLHVKKDSRLSQAAMETLAIVAYRQPILRADIEAIRGVASGEVLRGLMERQLVKIVGRAEVIGRPMLYGTSKRFLEVFGLANLDDLPRVEELRSGAEAPHPAAKATESAEPTNDDEGTSDSETEESSMSTPIPDDEHLHDTEDMDENDEFLEDFDDEEEFDDEDFDDMDDEEFDDDEEDDFDDDEDEEDDEE